MLRGRSLGQAIGGVALVCATFGVSTASAQVDYEIMASLQFNFSNPGARSLAMAGALTGAGDDATGAWTNPGGLTNITRPEVGVEFRGFDFETPFVSAGRFNGTPTNLGIDTVERADLRQHGQLDAQPVVRLGGRAQVALRLRVLPHRSRQLRGRHPDGRAVLRPGDRYGLLPVATRSLLPYLPGERQPRSPDLELRRVGGRASDRPVVGRRRRLVLRLRAQFGEPPFRPDRRAPDRAGRLLRPAVVRPRTTSCRHRVHPRRGLGSFGVNIGASINPNDKFRIGASYRQGPKFDIAYRRERLRRHPDWRAARQRVQGARRASPSACWSSRSPR